jgi:hypothetical protein
LLAFDLIFQELSFIVLDRAMKSRRKNRGSHSQDRRCFEKAKDRRLLLQRAERDVGTRVTSSKEFKLEN